MTMPDATRWTDLHHQLDQLASQLQQGESLSAAQQAHALQTRSQQWAALPGAVTDNSLSILGFTLGDDTYGVALQYVDEVMPLKQLTTLPGTPAFVRGVVNVRGRIVSVVDLRVLFALPQQGLCDRNHLLILRDAEMEFGLLADLVLGVHAVPPDSIQTEQAGLTGLRRQLLMGISTQHWQILDGARLLAEPALRIDDNE